ncbi:hypothetical protein N1851_006460 [Merluccius polli]|uniref:Transposase domain-containing protein n=1 Tax=Merluccius polli TaxID=89951 RepID=A0AA47P8H5_MERPO|nr:hypothetical protein N1851_006460 [Merluccius polli]
MERSQWSNLRRRAVKRTNDRIAKVEESLYTGVVWQMQGEMVSDIDLAENVETEIVSEVSDDETEDDEESPPPLDLSTSLSNWAVEYSVSLVSLSALLCILQEHHPFLPKDGRTLLKTTTKYTLEKLAGGVFFYFGILKMFGKTLEYLSSKIPDRHAFSLQLNMDGLPLFKSSSTQFWPVLGMLRGKGYISSRPLLIALYCGQSKPTSVHEYLGALVQELGMLSKGFVMGSKTLFLKVCSVICDAPARAFIKGIKSHSGYAGCDKCVQPGVYICHRMTFPEVSAVCRTDESFRRGTDEDHHLIVSPLLETGVGMVSQFPHDYMHLVCFGVMRRLLDMWFGSGGPLRCHSSSREMNRVSEKLVSLKAFVPVEFARKPRSLAERCRWKATELRQFLLYTGAVVLRGVLAEEIYSNFMLLSVAISVLANPLYCSSLNGFANTLLVSFVEHFSRLYGPEFVVYSVHGLTHLSNDVMLHGHLDLFSGFPFENYLCTLKKMVHKAHSPLTQVIRRVSEVEMHNQQCSVELKCLKRQAKGEHGNGPLPEVFEGEVQQFRELVCMSSGVHVKIANGDNCIRINQHVALVENILVYKDQEYIVYREFEKSEKFYDYPLDSREVGVLVVSHLSADLKCARLGEVFKYFRVPFGVEGMFHIASFTTTNEVEVVPAVWVNDNVCKWPPYKPDALHKAVRSHEQPKETWTPYPVKILYTSHDFEDARQRLSRAEIESDLQSEAEDDLRKRKPKPRQRFLPAELVIKKRPLPKLPAIPSLSSTLREAISPEPLPLHLSSEPSRFQQQCSPKSSRFQQQCSPESSRFQQQCSPESSRFQQQCSPESSRFQQQCSEPSRFQQQCSEPSRFQQQCSEPSRFQQQCSEPSRFQQQCSEPSRFQQQCSEPSRFQQQCSEPSRFQQQCSEPSRFQQQWPPEPSRFQQQWPPEPSRFQQQCSEPSRFQQQCSEPTQVDPMLRCEF